MNLYAYVAGNPVNLVDPSGLTVPVPPCHGPKWYCRLIGRTPTGVASTATLTPSFTPADAAGRLVLLLLRATCTAILPDVVDANTGILPGPRLTVPDLSAGYYPFPLYNEDRGMVILSFPLYSPEAGTRYLPFPLVAPNEVPALLEGPTLEGSNRRDHFYLASVEDLLMPGGKPFGRAGSDERIREVTGTVDDALNFFFELVHASNAVEVQHTSYRGLMYELPTGGYIGVREYASWRSPHTNATIDVNIKGIPIDEIKFNP